MGSAGAWGCMSVEEKRLQSPSLPLSSGPSSLADAIHATVQPAGKTSPTKMVPGHLRQGEEENGPGAHAGRPSSKAQNVQLPGVEGPQSCL